MATITTAPELAQFSPNQRYSLAEAGKLLRLGRSSIYREIKAGNIKVLKHRRRTYIPGSEIARLSCLAS
jgi:hypothetical protein